jgi:deoxyribonuclease (pyrimidine dimer)
MTRINATVDPEVLCDQHLMAEYREILRTVALATKAVNPVIPETFTLGTGHVKFFYDKLRYIHYRFEALKLELLKRGVAVTMQWDGSKIADRPDLYNDWPGTVRANKNVVDRIYRRATQMKKITYYGQKIDAIQYYMKMAKYYTAKDDN